MAALVLILRRRLLPEAGIGMVEAVLSAFVFLLVAGGTLGLLSKAEGMTAGAERHEAAVALAQRDVESLRKSGFAKLGLAVAPVAAPAGTSKNPSNPNEYVGGHGLKVRSDFHDRTSSAPPGVASSGEYFVVVAGGAAPGPTRVNAGGYPFDVYRYVTWVDLQCTVGAVDQCPGAQDAKRIVVAVVPALTGTVNGRRPAWVTSVLTDPKAVSTYAEPPPTPTPTSQTAQPFFLYDTACNIARVAPSAAHGAHDTGRLGNHCGSGADRPDLMGTSSPPTPAGGLPPLYDYSTDFPGTRTDPMGLALQPPPAAAADCPTSYSSSFATEKHRVHRWATASMPVAFTGDTRSALSVWTRTVNAAAGEATLCAALHKVGATGTVATPALATATHRIAVPSWPTEASQVSFAFDHPAFSLAVGERLMLTVSLTRNSLPGGIELLYDHPSFDSVLSVGTTTPLP